jgi:hypothetical protein
MSELWEEEGFGAGGAEPADDGDEGDEGLQSVLEGGLDDPDELGDESWDEGEED